MEPLTASRIASRTVLRLSRPRHAPALRVSARRIPNYRARFQSTSTAPSSGSSASPLVAGVAGGAVVFLGGYAYYHFSGAKSIVNTATETKGYLDTAFKKATETAPAPNEAIQWLRSTTQAYAAFIPGAKGYVDSAFDDLDVVQKKHSSEVDKITQDAYDQMKEASKSGLSLETANKAWNILQETMKKISSLAADAADDIMENHPELKEKVGGSLQQLKAMGDSYGPEAKKQADQTWQQVQDIIKGGVGVGTIDKIRQLIQDKSEELKKFGDQAWAKGMEAAQPVLDKQPELKEMVEKNKDKLLKGDLGQLWEKLKSGDVDEIKKYVQEQTKKVGEKASKSSGIGGGLEGFFGLIPGGKEILPKLQQLQELSEKRGKEAEQLVKDAITDIKGVLEKKLSEGKNLAEKAGKDAEGVEGNAKKGAEDVKEGVKEKAGDAKDKAEDVKDDVKDKAEDVKKGTKDKVEDAKKGAKDVKDDAKKGAKDAKGAAEEKVKK